MSEDSKTIQLILNGEYNKYADLMEKHKIMVCSIVGKRIPVQDVEEVVQNTFIKAYDSLASFSGKSVFANWLSRIAVRTCCDYWRKQQRHRTISMTPDQEHNEWLEAISSGDSITDFENGKRKREARELLQWTLAQLSAEDRTLIEMVYFEECPLKETAEVLNWGLAKTKVRAMRARHKMRKIIQSLQENK